MKLFFDWINLNLTVSAHPLNRSMKDAWWNDFDLIINVSDQIDHRFQSELASHRKSGYWLPMGESFGIPLENVFGALSILWYAEKNNRKVFIHCVAGRNRSIMVLDCYYFLRNGKHRADNSKDVLYGKNKSNKLITNINDNQLPGIYRMEHFLEKCKELFENPKIADNAYIDWLKKQAFKY